MAKGKLKENGFAKDKLAKTRRRRKAGAQARTLQDIAARPNRNDLLPTLRVDYVPIEELKPFQHRTTKHSAEQLERVMRSIEDTGFNDPLLVRGNIIIHGHMRWEAAKRLGLKSLPVIDCQHLTEVEARKLHLALNRTAQLGELDLDKLKIEFRELIELGEDMTATGFSLADQDIILLDDEIADEEEQLPDDDVRLPVVSRVGDVWELKPHRIICGDAVKEETYAALLGEDPVHAAIADFPYNVRIKGNVSGLGKKTHEDFVMASGEMSDGDFAGFLAEVSALVARRLVAGGVFFGFIDFRSVHRLYEAYLQSLLHILNLICWYKESGGMGAFYRSAHELIVVGCKGNSPRVNNIQLGRNGRDRTNVWCFPGANRRGSSANEMLAQHATPKPVELCVDAILDVTTPGEAVLDPFLGSGTTIIAAEKSGRIGYGIELDPKFVDVAVRRWETLTGREATLASTGETFQNRAAAVSQE